MNAVLGSLLNKPNGYLNSRLRHVMRSVYEARSKTQDAIRDTRFVVCALTNTNRVFASQLMLYQVLYTRKICSLTVRVIELFGQWILTRLSRHERHAEEIGLRSTLGFE